MQMPICKCSILQEVQGAVLLPLSAMTTFYSRKEHINDSRAGSNSYKEPDWDYQNSGSTSWMINWKKLNVDSAKQQEVASFKHFMFYADIFANKWWFVPPSITSCVHFHSFVMVESLNAANGCLINSLLLLLVTHSVTTLVNRCVRTTTHTHTYTHTHTHTHTHTRQSSCSHLDETGSRTLTLSLSQAG